MTAKEYADTIDYERNRTLTKAVAMDIFNAGVYEGTEREKVNSEKERKGLEVDLAEQKLINNALKGATINVSEVLYKKRDMITTTQKSYDIKWHKFPDELPDDLQTVLTVAVNPVDSHKIYHTFTFSEKPLFEHLKERGKDLSLAFLGFSSDRHYDVTAWCEIPTYEDVNGSE